LTLSAENGERICSRMGWGLGSCLRITDRSFL
jgi:hypothetical protein